MSNFNLSSLGDCQNGIWYVNDSFSYIETDGKVLYRHESSPALQKGAHFAIKACLTKFPDSFFLNHTSVDGALSSQQQGSSVPSSHMDPFYVSTVPLVSAITASCCVSWVFVVILLLNRRPWLQRLSAILMAVYMTIAICFTMADAKAQYYSDGLDSDTSRKVVNSTGLAIVSFIAVFVSRLSEVQILVRMYTRRTNRSVVKWLGLVLAALELVFVNIDRFVRQPLIPLPANASSSRISALYAAKVLSYLFQIGFAALYFLGVIYYTVSMQRFRHCYWGKNGGILLLAFLSLCTLFAPIILPVLSIWDSRNTWSNQVRLVLILAGVIVVWEWVLRVEQAVATERKGGALGHEIYEDEMEPDSGEVVGGESSSSDGSNNLAGQSFSSGTDTRKPNGVTSSESLDSNSCGSGRPKFGQRLLCNLRGRARKPRSDASSSQQTTIEMGADTFELPEIVVESRSSRADGGVHSDSSSATLTSIPGPAPQSGEEAVQQHADEAKPEYSVHPGFHRDDYWPDEKSER